jgi:5-methylcytosine-specific restriction endonuclease McrA
MYLFDSNAEERDRRCMARMNARGRRRRKRFYDENVTCHLCGLRIPVEVVNLQHALAGTIDHVIPRADGGPDTAANRLPAHKTCNQFRDRKPITEELRKACRHRAVFWFHKLGIDPGKTKKRL